MPKISRQQALFAWLTCALFFTYQYILRVAPGVLNSELRQDFNVHAETYATLGSFYLYAYAALQIPLGWLVDHFGIRRMVLISLGCCLGGTYFFASAASFLDLQISRVFIGTGSAIAFMSALKITADYFEKGKRGLLMGLTLSFGTVGAMLAGKPLVMLVDMTGWRDAILFSGFLGLPLILMAVFLLPSGHAVHRLKKEVNASTTFSILKSIFKNQTLMIYTLLAIGLYTPLSTLADLWGTEFLRQKYSLTLADAAQANTMMYLGMAIGSLVLSWYFESRGKINQGIQVSGIVLFLVMFFLIYGPNFNSWELNLWIVSLILLVLGFFCGAEMLCFTGTSFHTTPMTSGLTLGVVNTMNMLGGALLQQAIGFGLDWQWEGATLESGIRFYSESTYQFALTSLLGVIAICIVASIFLKKEHKTKQIKE